MKKIFVTLILIILALMVLTPYFAGMIFDLPEDILNLLFMSSLDLNYILSASAISWAFGVLLGFLLSKIPFYRIICSFTDTFSVLPAFLLSAVFMLFFKLDLLTVLCIPLFFRALSSSANIFAGCKKANYKVHSLGLTPAIYFSKYTVPFLVSPLFLCFLRLVRSAIISMAFLSFSVPDASLTFYTRVGVAILAVLLLNTLCLIIPGSEGGKTWAARL